MYRKILIVRFSSIGDIVLTTPVIRCVKEQTGAEVHFLTKAAYAGIVEANPYVDRVISIKKDLKEIARTLVQGSYDGCMDLHGNLRTLELKARLKLSPNRVKITTFDKLNIEKYLLTQWKVDRMPATHIVQRYLAAAAPFGVRDDGKGLDYFIPQPDRVDLEAEGLPPHYLAFVIGAAHATKRLTEPQIRRFCERLPSPIVLLGGPAEKELGGRAALGLPHVVNACGRYKLAGSADLVRQAAVVLTHDTGLMHIAAAFRKPIVSVWGNTVPAFGMYPYLPSHEDAEEARRHEVPGLACRPCSKIGYAECPQGHFRCIEEQSVEALVAQCKSLLRANG